MSTMRSLRLAPCCFVTSSIRCAAWLVSHRNRGDVHKGLPYESGIDTYGDTHGRFGLSFYIYALLFVAFDIEVVFIYLWAVVFRDLPQPLVFTTMLVFVAILLFGLAYAWRKGVLSWGGPGRSELAPPSDPATAEGTSTEPVVIER